MRRTWTCQWITFAGVCLWRIAAGGPLLLSLTFIQSNPVTTIMVGGQSVQAIVDTGGGAIKLSKEVLERAGAVGLGDTVTGTDSLGRQAKQPRFRVPVLTIGGQTFRDMVVIQASEADGAPTPNGIGRQFLSQYLVVVDYSGGAITLWSPNTKRPGMNCGGTRIPMEHTDEDDQLAVSEFQTQNGHVRLLWDTGATYSMLPQTLAGTLRLATTAQGETKFWEADPLSVSGHNFGPLEFVIQPLKLPDDFEGMLGQNFFARHLVCIDYKLREIHVR